MPEDSLTAGLTTLLLRPVDAASRDRARSHVLDWVGIVGGATDTDEGRILLGHAQRRPPGPCTTIGAPARTAEVAVLVNAGLGMILELDDVHRGARLHPGPVVIPAALAAAELVPTTVGAFLDAVIRGYEATIRVGESVGAVHYRHWHTTATCGTFGAAAAAASVFGLDASQTVHALGNAGTRASGLWQCRPERTMSKPVHAGGAAQAGLLAAELAADGLTGPREILEGELGLYAATCPDANPSALTGGTAQWRIHASSLKPWPGCRHAHPAVTAALDLRAEQSLEPDEIGAVTIRTYDDALVFADAPHPRSRPEALFSLQQMVGWSLLHGEPTAATFEPAALEDPGIRALRDRISVLVSDELEAAYPAEWRASVEVETPTGRRQRTAPGALGDPARPMAPSAVITKAADLLAGVGVADSRQRIEAIDGLGEERPVAALASLLPTQLDSSDHRGADVA